MTAEQYDDPISAASVGLRALGVAPQRRVETLGLLSTLLDLADDHGEVPLDHALMAAEERLGIDACLEGYEWLERVGVIRRTWGGWRISNFAAHRGPVGMTEASMAVLQRHLVAPAARRTPVVHRSARRRRIPVVAATVAAGLAAFAGVHQFAPQAAVNARSAVVDAGAARSTAPPPAADATFDPAAAAPVAPIPSAVSPVTGPITTTTSTTLLPGLPCLSHAVEDLASRTGLSQRRTSEALPPGVVSCP